MQADADELQAEATALQDQVDALQADADALQADIDKAETDFILLYVRLLSLLRIFIMYYVTFKGTDETLTDIEKAIKKEYKVMYMLALCFKWVEPDHTKLDETLKMVGLTYHTHREDIFDAINRNMKYTDFLLEPIFTGSRVTDIHLYSVENKPESSVKLCSHSFKFINATARNEDVSYIDCGLSIDLSSIDYDTLQDMLLGDNGEYEYILI